MVDTVRHGLASAHVIGDVFDVGHGAGAGGHVHGGDLETEPMTRLELIRGRQDLDLILEDLTGLGGGAPTAPPHSGGPPGPAAPPGRPPHSTPPPAPGKAAVPQS